MRTDRTAQLRRITRLNKFVLFVVVLWTIASFALLITVTRKFVQPERYGIQQTAHSIVAIELMTRL